MENTTQTPEPFVPLNQNSPVESSGSTNEEFTFTSIVKAGWRAYKQRPFFIFFVGVIYAILSGILELVLGVLEVSLTPLMTIGLVALVVAFVSFAVSLWLNVGVSVIMFTHVLKGEASHSLLLSSPHHWLLFKTTLLYTAVVLFGYLLLVVPGIIFAIMFLVAPMFAYTRGCSPMEALALSAEATKGVRWWILLYGLGLGLLALSGVLALVIGIIVTIGIAVCAQVVMLKRLSDRVTQMTEVVVPKWQQQLVTIALVVLGALLAFLVYFLIVYENIDFSAPIEIDSALERVA